LPDNTAKLLDAVAVAGDEVIPLGALTELRQFRDLEICNPLEPDMVRGIVRTSVEVASKAQAQLL
jgi:hypothetical protein